MNAVVELVNSQRGMVAARTDDDEYVILELLGSKEPEIGDVLTHPDFHSLGSERYRNVSQSEDIDVYVQNVVGNLTAAKTQCFLM